MKIHSRSIAQGSGFALVGALVLMATLAIAVLATGSCSRNDSRTPDNDPPQTLPPAEMKSPAVSFGGVIQPIFSKSCALTDCHGGKQTPNLSPERSYGNLVRVASVEVPALMRIEPGKPDSSYLYHKITGAPDIVGKRMPRGKPPLPQDQIDAIRHWIEQGALAE